MEDMLWNGVGVLTLPQLFRQDPQKNKKTDLLIMDLLGLSRDRYTF